MSFNVDSWVSLEFERLAQVINDYDEYLFLEMVPVAEQQHLNDKNKVFRIVDDRNKSIVMYADSLANPQAILERLWSMDLKHNDVMGKLDAHNAAIEALNNQKKIEERGLLMEFAQFVLKNKKSRWEHDGRVFDDQFRDLGPKKKSFS
jgi:hypothetical protein